MPIELIEPLEALIFQAIGLTTLALATVGGGEMTLTWWRALSILGTHGSCNVTELARAMSMSMPSASRLVTRLKDRGLVTAEPDPTNRRVLVVRLTPLGQQVRNNVLHERRGMMEQALTDERLPNKLIPGIRAIADAFRESQGTDRVTVTIPTLTPSRQGGRD